MARRKAQHIDAILQDWPYEPGEIAARIVKGTDGRGVLQLRLDMGVLQMEMHGRPDNSRPGGEETYYDFILHHALIEGDGFVLSDEQCEEIDREFMQYYHRRTCWLALREFGRAVEDADHTLALMDLSRRYSDDEEWTLSHEQYRPFVLFHRTQAKALADLQESGPEAAIAALNDGLERFRRLFTEYEAEDHFDEDDLVKRLSEMREALRDHYEVGRTLEEKLTDAIEAEMYEEAAKLRDEIARRQMG